MSQKYLHHKIKSFVINENQQIVQDSVKGNAETTLYIDKHNGVRSFLNTKHNYIYSNNTEVDFIKTIWSYFENSDFLHIPITISSDRNAGYKDIRYFNQLYDFNNNDTLQSIKSQIILTKVNQLLDNDILNEYGNNKETNPYYKFCVRIISIYNDLSEYIKFDNDSYRNNYNFIVELYNSCNKFKNRVNSSNINHYNFVENFPTDFYSSYKNLNANNTQFENPLNIIQYNGSCYYLMPLNQNITSIVDNKLYEKSNLWIADVTNKQTLYWEKCELVYDNNALIYTYNTVVKHNNTYYYCKKGYNKSGNNITTVPGGDNSEYWEKIEQYWDKNKNYNLNSVVLFKTDNDQVFCYKSLTNSNKCNNPENTSDPNELVHTFQNRSKTQYRPNYGKALDQMYSKVKYLITDDNSIPIYDTEFSFLSRIYVGNCETFIDKLTYDISKYNSAGSLGCYIKSSTVKDGFNYQLFLTRLHEDKLTSQQTKDLYIADIIKNIEDDMDIISYLDKKAVISQIDTSLYGDLGIENNILQYNRDGLNYSTIPSNLLLNNNMSLNVTNNSIVYNYYKLKNNRDPHLNFNVSIQSDTDYLYQLNQLFDPEKNQVEFQFSDGIIQTAPNSVKSFDKLTGIRKYNNVGNISIDDKPWYGYNFISVKDDHFLDTLRDYKILNDDQYNMYNLINKYPETLTVISDVLNELSETNVTYTIDSYIDNCNYLSNILNNYNQYKLLSNIIDKHFFNVDNTSHFNNIFNNTFCNRSFQISKTFEIIRYISNNYNDYIKSFNYMLKQQYITEETDLYTIYKCFLLINNDGQKDCELCKNLNNLNYIDAQLINNTTDINVDLVIQRNLLTNWEIKTLQFLLDNDIIYHNDNNTTACPKINAFGNSEYITNIIDFCEKTNIEEAIEYTTHDLQGNNFTVSYIISFLNTFIDIYKSFLDNILNYCELLFDTNQDVNDMISFINSLLPIDSADYINLQYTIEQNNLSPSLNTLLNNFNNSEDKYKSIYNNPILIKINDANILYPNILKLNYTSSCTIQNMVQFAVNYNSFNNTVQYFKNNIVKNESTHFSNVRLTLGNNTTVDSNAAGAYSSSVDNNVWIRTTNNGTFKLVYDGAAWNLYSVTSGYDDTPITLSVNDKVITNKSVMLDSLLVDNGDYLGKETKYLKYVLDNSINSKIFVNKQIQLLQKLKDYFNLNLNKSVKLSENDKKTIKKINDGISKASGDFILNNDLLKVLQDDDLDDHIDNPHDPTNTTVYTEKFDNVNDIAFNDIISEEEVKDKNYPSQFAGYMNKFLHHLMKIDPTVNDTNNETDLTDDETNKVSGIMNWLGLEHIDYIEAKRNATEWDSTKNYEVSNVVTYNDKYFECVKKIVIDQDNPRVITTDNSEYWKMLEDSDSTTIKDLFNSSIDFKCLSNVINTVSSGLFKRTLPLFSNFTKVIVNDTIQATPSVINNNEWDVRIDNIQFKLYYMDDQWRVFNSNSNEEYTNAFKYVKFSLNGGTPSNLTRYSDNLFKYYNNKYDFSYDIKTDTWFITDKGSSQTATINTPYKITSEKYIKNITAETTPSLYSLFKWFGEEYNFDQYNNNIDKRVSNLTKIKDDLKSILDHSYINTEMVTIENIFNLLFMFRSILVSNEKPYLFVILFEPDVDAIGSYVKNNDIWVREVNNKTFTISTAVNDDGETKIIVKRNNVEIQYNEGDLIIDSNDLNTSNSTNILNTLRQILNKDIDVDYQYVKDLYSNTYNLFQFVVDIYTLYYSESFNPTIQSMVENTLDELYSNQSVVDIIYNLLFQGLTTTEDLIIETESGTQTSVKYTCIPLYTPNGTALTDTKSGMYINLNSNDYTTVVDYWMDLSNTNIFKQDVSYNLLSQLINDIPQIKSLLSNQLILKTTNVQVLFNELSKTTPVYTKFISYADTSKNSERNALQNSLNELMIDGRGLRIIKDYIGIGDKDDNTDMLFKNGIITIYDLINFININNIFVSIKSELDSLLVPLTSANKDSKNLFTIIKSNLHYMLNNSKISDLTSIAENAENWKKFEIFTTSPIITRDSNYLQTKVEDLIVKIDNGNINSETIVNNFSIDNSTDLKKILKYENTKLYYVGDITYYNNNWYKVKYVENVVSFRDIVPTNTNNWELLAPDADILSKIKNDGKLNNTSLNNLFVALDSIQSFAENLSNISTELSSFNFNTFYTTNLYTTVMENANFNKLLGYNEGRTANVKTYIYEFINLNYDAENQFDDEMTISRVKNLAGTHNTVVNVNTLISNVGIDKIMSSDHAIFYDTNINNPIIDTPASFFAGEVGSGLNSTYFSTKDLTFNNFHTMEFIKVLDLYNNYKDAYDNLKNTETFSSLQGETKLQSDLTMKQLNDIRNLIVYNNNGYFRDIVNSAGYTEGNTQFTNFSKFLLDNISSINEDIHSQNKNTINTTISLMHDVFNSSNISIFNTVGNFSYYLSQHADGIRSLFGDPDNSTSSTVTRFVSLNYVWPDCASNKVTFDRDNWYVNHYMLYDVTGVTKDTLPRYFKVEGNSANDLLYNLYNPGGDPIAANLTGATNKSFFMPIINDWSSNVTYKSGDMVVKTIQLSASNITSGTNTTHAVMFGNTKVDIKGNKYEKNNEATYYTVSVFYRSKTNGNKNNSLPRENQYENDYWSVYQVGFDAPTNDGILWRNAEEKEYLYDWSHVINEKVGGVDQRLNFVVAFSYDMYYDQSESVYGHKGREGEEGKPDEMYIVYVYDPTGFGTNFSFTGNFAIGGYSRFGGITYKCIKVPTTPSAFDGTKGYAVGDKVLYNNIRYKCIKAISAPTADEITGTVTPKPFNSSEWIQLTPENDTENWVRVRSTGVPYATKNGTGYKQHNNWKILLNDGSGGYIVSSNDIITDRNKIATFVNSTEAATAYLKYKDLISESEPNSETYCETINTIGSSSDSMSRMSSLLEGLLTLQTNNNDKTSYEYVFLNYIYGIANTTTVYDLITNNSYTQKSVECINSLRNGSSADFVTWLESNFNIIINDSQSDYLTTLLGSDDDGTSLNWLNYTYSIRNNNTTLTYGDCCRILESLKYKSEEYNYVKKLFTFIYSYNLLQSIGGTSTSIDDVIFFKESESDDTLNINNMLMYCSHLFSIINNQSFNSYNYELATIHSLITWFNKYIVNENKNITNIYYLLEYITSVTSEFDNNAIDYIPSSNLIPNKNTITLKNIYDILNISDYSSLISKFNSNNNVYVLFNLFNIINNYRNYRTTLTTDYKTSDTLQELYTQETTKRDKQSQDQQVINNQLLNNPILLYNKNSNELNAGLNDTLFNFFQFLSLLNTNLSSVEVDDSQKNNSCMYQFFKQCCIIMDYNNTYSSYINQNFTLSNLINALNNISDDDVYNFINVIYPTLILTGSPEHDKNKSWVDSYTSLNGAFKLNTIPIEVTKKLNLLSPSSNIYDLTMLYDVFKYIKETAEMGIIYNESDTFKDVFDSLECIYCNNPNDSATAGFLFSFVADYHQRVLNIYGNISKENQVYELIKYKIDNTVWTKYFKDVVDIATNPRMSQLNHIRKINSYYGITANYFQRYIFNSEIYPTIVSHIDYLNNILTTELGALTNVLNYEKNYPFNSIIITGSPTLSGVYQPTLNYNTWTLTTFDNTAKYVNTATYNRSNNKWTVAQTVYTTESTSTPSNTVFIAANDDLTWVSSSITLKAVAKYRNINDLLVLMDNIEVIYTLHNSGLLDASKVEISQFNYFNENIYSINNIVINSLLTETSTIEKLKQSMDSINMFKLLYGNDITSINSIQILNNIMTNFSSIELISKMITTSMDLNNDGEEDDINLKPYKFIKYILDIGEKLQDVLSTIKSLNGTSSTMDDLIKEYRNHYVYKCLEQVNKDLKNVDLLECSKGIFKYNQTEAHKSNIYSIKIKNSNLSLDGITDQNEKNKRTYIRQLFEQAIREHIKRYMPAHTHLWKIIYED